MSKFSLRNNLIAKGNDLIEARFKFTLWETRVFTRMVSLIKRKDTEFKIKRLYIKDLMDFYESTSKEDYNIIKLIPDSLNRKQIQIQGVDENGTKMWRGYSLFPTVGGTLEDAEDNEKGYDSYIELRFNQDLMPQLLQLQDKFKIYDIQYIIPLRSVYSIRIYELLKQYENIGTRSISLSELKEILSLLETQPEMDNRIRNLAPKDRRAAKEAGRVEQYKKYTDFKKRVLNQAKKELDKHCDITFEVEEVRRKRKVENLVFSILPNNNKSRQVKGVKIKKLPKSLVKKLDNLSFAEDKAYSLLVDFGMLPKTIIKELIPSLKKGGMDGFEDLFVGNILSHFQSNADSIKPNVLYNWWIKKGVYTEGSTWAKLVEALNKQKKEMQTKDPEVFDNRMQAKSMTKDKFKKWYAKKGSLNQE